MRRAISKAENRGLGKSSCIGAVEKQGILNIKFQFRFFSHKKCKYGQPGAGTAAQCSCHRPWFTTAFQMERRVKGKELEQGALVPFINKGK